MLFPTLHLLRLASTPSVRLYHVDPHMTGKYSRSAFWCRVVHVLKSETVRVVSREKYSMLFGKGQSQGSLCTRFFVQVWPMTQWIWYVEFHCRSKMCDTDSALWFTWVFLHLQQFDWVPICCILEKNEFCWIAWYCQIVWMEIWLKQSSDPFVSLV